MGARPNVRKRMFWTQRGLCHWCRQEMHLYERFLLSSYAQQDPRAATFDHLIPVSAGGTNKQSNLVLACAKCNGLRKNMPADKWLDSWETRSIGPPVDRLTPPAPAVPLDDTMYILKHGKKAWREMRARAVTAEV